MDLYTLSDTFLANEVIDEFVSAIWTERYSAAGDVQLVVPATMDNIAKLAPGTRLALRGTKEVALLETQSIEKNLLTVKGFTLVEFLNERYAWARNATSSAIDARVIDYSETNSPGEAIANLVSLMVINAVPFTSTWEPANLEWEDDEILFLSLGAVDTTGADERFTFPIGPLYDAIASVAKQASVGISLYLDSADPDTGYVLKFTTYRGQDRTSDQDVNELVRLTPQLDSLSEVKELHSIANYKNVAYVYYKGEAYVRYADPSAPVPVGFDRRVLLVNPEKAAVGYGGGAYVTAPELSAFIDNEAKNALANYNYIHAIDGQTSPISDYKYGVHYGLGDMIELEGVTGAISKAQVTEYIRSHDQTGEKEYPTIAVVGAET